MCQDQVNMKPLVLPNLSWNPCLLGLWAAHKDLLQAFRRIYRDNQALHNIRQIMPQLIWNRLRLFLEKKAGSFLPARMWYSSQAPDHIHFLLNISNQGLQWESNSMKAKRMQIPVLDNMKTLDNQFNLNHPLIQWVAVHQGTLVLPRLDLGLQVPVPTRLGEKSQ